jgi:hypothetical protein
MACIVMEVRALRLVLRVLCADVFELEVCMVFHCCLCVMKQCCMGAALSSCVGLLVRQLMFAVTTATCECQQRCNVLRLQTPMLHCAVCCVVLPTPFLWCAIVVPAGARAAVWRVGVAWGAGHRGSSSTPLRARCSEAGCSRAVQQARW